MRERRIEILKELVINKKLKFQSTGHYDNFEIILNENNELVIEHYGYRCETPDYYNIDDICFISFHPKYVSIEIEKSKNSSIGIGFDCKTDGYNRNFMEVLNPNGYYTGDAKNKLIEMIKDGKKFKIDEYMDPEVEWKSNSEIILIDDKLFLKFGSLKPNPNAEDRAGFFIDDIEEMLIYKDNLHISFEDMYSFLFKIV